MFSGLKEEYALGTLMADGFWKMLPADAVIIKDKAILGGTPVFRGTRVPFQALLNYLEGGQSLEEFLDDFPTVTREAAIAALELAKSSLVNHLG
jgi:uncharacterized protein (DUF433 family)